MKTPAQLFVGLFSEMGKEASGLEAFEMFFIFLMIVLVWGGGLLVSIKAAWYYIFQMFTNTFML